MLNSLLLIGSFGTTEILLIVFVVILLFGAKRIPELFKGMGQGVREFKDATKAEETAVPPPPVPPPYQQQQPPYQQPQAPYQQPQPPYQQTQQPQAPYQQNPNAPQPPLS